MGEEAFLSLCFHNCKQTSNGPGNQTDALRSKRDIQINCREGVVSGKKKHWLGVIGYILKKAKISSELVDFY